MHKIIPAVLALVLFITLASTAAAASSVFVQASTDSYGTSGNGGSDLWPVISAGGRYVAFESAAGNLTAGDTNNVRDIFVKDVISGTTSRVSTTAGGDQADGASREPSISGDGRYVVFRSDATNLVSGDANGVSDVFLKDMLSGSILRVSTDAAGEQADGASDLPDVADNGDVIFRSSASNLVSGDTNAATDIFVKRAATGLVTRVSVSSWGAQGDLESGEQYGPAITADGRYTAYSSNASNLVYGDTNSSQDIFFHDTADASTTRVSTDAAGQQGNGNSLYPTISDDGRYVAFRSHASNLASGDANTASDIFVKDRLTGQVHDVSTDAAGNQGTLSSWDPFISADGRYVTFATASPNIVAGDTNNTFDVFVKDLQSGAVDRVSVNSLGEEGNNWSFGSSISRGGRQVAFESQASNLAAAETNGFFNIFVSASPYCGGSRQPLTLTRGDIYWASYSDYQSRVLSVGYNLTNGGTQTAFDVRMEDALTTNGVILYSPTPVPAGDIAAGASAASTLRYVVPPGIAVFRTMVQASSRDDCGSTYTYP